MLEKEQLGQKIKEIRKSKKITQEKLAEIIGVDCGYISKLEVGQNFPSIPTLNKIAEALNVEISKFFSYTDISKLDVKEEISKIVDSCTKEEQVLLYKIAKSIK